MKDSSLRLQDKNVIIVGPFNGTTQAILRGLTEFGASVGLISEAPAGRYVDGVNEAREVHASYGRAAHFNMALDTDKKIQDVLGQVVGTLGRVDCFIDASPLTWTSATDARDASEACLAMAEKWVPFFLAKQRGRIVYLIEDPSLAPLRSAACADALQDLTGAMNRLAAKYRAQNVTVNAITIGVTEDFILTAFPKTPSIKKSFEELAGKHPGVRLVETNDIALSTAYLCSAMSAAVTGQVLRLTGGFHLAGAQSTPSADYAAGL
jgi:NAD(P)-dependent dehydrogenase (short-subunit alcohol dehydrogenase family)